MSAIHCLDLPTRYSLPKLSPRLRATRAGRPILSTVTLARMPFRRVAPTINIQVGLAIAAHILRIIHGAGISHDSISSPALRSRRLPEVSNLLVHLCVGQFLGPRDQFFNGFDRKKQTMNCFQ